MNKLLEMYLNEVSKYEPVAYQDEKGLSLAHCHWMILEMMYGEPPRKETKEHRWLGYIQCLLNFHAIYTLDELKQHSRTYLKGT